MTANMNVRRWRRMERCRKLGLLSDWTWNELENKTTVQACGYVYNIMPFRAYVCVYAHSYSARTAVQKYYMLCTRLAVFLAWFCVHVCESDRFLTTAERGHVPGHLEDVSDFLKHSSCKEEHRSTTAHSWKTEKELLRDLLLTKLWKYTHRKQ